MTKLLRVGIVAFNAVEVTTGPKNARRVIRAAARHSPTRRCQGCQKLSHGAPSILLGSETGDVTQHDDDPDLDPEIWRVIHRGADVEKDGSLIALRREVIRALAKPRWTKLCDGVRPRGDDKGMNARWCPHLPIKIIGTGLELDIGAGHWAPDRYPDRQADCAEAMRELELDLAGGDFNRPRPAVQRALRPQQVRTVEVMSIVGRPGLRLGPARAIRLPGSDHPGNRTNMLVQAA